MVSSASSASEVPPCAAPSAITSPNAAATSSASSAAAMISPTSHRNVPVFNWYSLPTFGSMLLFWALAAYVLTRSPRSAISLTAVGAQVATALFLLVAAMQANADTVAQWSEWSRSMSWGAAVAPTLWYWLTTLLLREQGDRTAERYLRRLGYPLGGRHCRNVCGTLHIHAPGRDRLSDIGRIKYGA